MKNTKTKRDLKVGYRFRSGDYKRIPNIVLQGKWLECFGFTLNDRVSVECSDGCLIIRKCPAE